MCSLDVLLLAGLESVTLAFLLHIYPWRGNNQNPVEAVQSYYMKQFDPGSARDEVRYMLWNASKRPLAGLTLPPNSWQGCADVSQPCPSHGAFSWIDPRSWPLPWVHAPMMMDPYGVIRPGLIPLSFAGPSLLRGLWGNHTIVQLPSLPSPQLLISHGFLGGLCVFFPENMLQ